jgi:hypothetical protein
MDPVILYALTANQTVFLTPCKGTATVLGLLEHQYVLFSSSGKNTFEIKISVGY